MKFQMEFDGFDFSPYLVVEKVRRPFIQTTTHNTVRVGTRPGKRLLNVLVEESVIEVDIRVIEKSREEATETENIIASHLPFQKECVLRLRDRLDIFNNAVVSAVDYEKIRHTGGGTISFVLYDPYNYSASKNIYRFSDEINFENSGIEAIKPKVTITGASGDHLELRSITLGEVVYVNAPVIASDIIEIDFEEEKIRKNNELFMIDLDYNSDFFDLITGHNRLKLSSGTATIEFNRRVI